MSIYKQRISVVICQITLQSKPKLPHVVDALNTQCSSFGLRNYRQQKRGENSDDGDDRQKFNQSER